MSTILLIVLLVVFIGLGVLSFIVRKHPRKLKTADFGQDWKMLQRNCADKKTWPLAIIEADNLLDKALKTRKYRGKTTGERLVAAQHQLSSNDSVWFGHKLRNKLVHENLQKLSKKDVMYALGGFRQALRDLGALNNEKSQ